METKKKHIGDRHLVCALTHRLPLPQPDTTITDRVFMDFSLCPTFFRGSSKQPILCPDLIPLGRLVLGLYGHFIPITVANFKAMVTSAAYKGATVHKLFPGQYFLEGHQGDKPCDVKRSTGLIARNTVTVDPKAFELTHSRPGLVSLSLFENDDDNEIKLDPNYRNEVFWSQCEEKKQKRELEAKINDESAYADQSTSMSTENNSQ